MHKRTDAEIKVKVRRNPRKALRNLILIIIAAYVIFITYTFIRDLVVTRLAGAQPAQQGVVQLTAPATGILVRDEKVINAPRSGKLKVIAHEGERVRVGAVVAQVVVASLDSKTGEAVFNIVTPKAGVVSYYVDGLENVYSPKNISELDLNKIETIKPVSQNFKPGSQVEEGKPVCKIVNNLAPVTVMAVSKDVLKFPDNSPSSIQVALSSNNAQIYQAVLLDKAFRGKANQFLFSLANYDDYLMTARKQDFDIITARYAGYIVPAQAIVRKDGEDGIFTIYKERVKWKNVQIEGSYEEKVIVSGLTPDIKVITHPEYVNEGRPFR